MEKKEPTKDEPNNKQELPAIPEDIVSQIMMVRDTGRTNMLDVISVRQIAAEMDQMQLAEFLCDGDNREAYFNFILFGKRKENKE